MSAPNLLMILTACFLRWSTATEKDTVIVPHFDIIPVESGLLVKWYIDDYETQTLSFYQIEIQDNPWTRTIQANENISSLLLDNLEPCHSYTISVTTVIKWKYQMRTVWTCGTPLPKVPGEVRGLRARSLSSGTEQMISWRRPADVPPECHLTYAVIMRSARGHEFRFGFTVDGMHLIKNLEPSTTYYYKVQTMYEEMRGEMSDVIEEITTPGEVPVSPYAFKFIPLEGSANLTWKLPDGGTEFIQKYHLLFDGVFYEILNGSQTHFLVSDLNECSWYCMELTAVAASLVQSRKVVTCGTPLTTSPCTERRNGNGVTVD